MELKAGKMKWLKAWWYELLKGTEAGTRYGESRESARLFMDETAWPGYGEHEIGSRRVLWKDSGAYVERWSYTFYAFGWVQERFFYSLEDAKRYAEQMALHSQDVLRGSAQKPEVIVVYEVRP